jgi:hypothetical protein
VQYISKEAGDSRIVWLKSKNRYIVLQKPAFDIFKCLATGRSEEGTAKWFSEKYGINIEDALFFTQDIHLNIKQLKANNLLAEYPKTDKIDTLRLKSLHSNLSKNYLVFGKRIQFSYYNSWLMDMVHPGLAHLEIHSEERADVQFSLFQDADELILKINDDRFFCWPVDKSEYFKGSVSLQLLNFLYGLNDKDWMGAFHAAALSKNNQAVLISAPSGFGKSTLTALLMAKGLNLISDDLVPISRKNQQIFSYPAGISVKPGAIGMLSAYFPELKNAKTRLNTSTGKEVTCIAPSSKVLQEAAKVKAILFPEFNKNVDFEWEKVDNISVLNDFITESWIASDENSVSIFLDWFFQLPCYRLRYSSNEMAVQKIQELFESL